jgi:BMFP domain-containing protein YqiC
VREMAVRARTEQEELAERVTSLEALVATLTAEHQLAEKGVAPKRPLHTSPPHNPGTGVA